MIYGKAGNLLETMRGGVSGGDRRPAVRLAALALGLATIVGCSVLAVPSARAAEPSLRAAVEREQIFEGESVLYRVLVNNVEDPRRPEIDGGDRFDVAPRGESSQNRITIINGRRSETRGRAYDYQLTPLQAGRLAIPAPQLEVDGQVLTGNRVTLTVIAPTDQDLVDLRITADRTEVYPMQPFTITLTASIQGLPAPYDDEDPIAVLREPPHLTIPWAIDEQLDAGLQPRVPWQRWLGNWRHPRGLGFRVNNVRSGSLLSLLDGPGMGFLPEPREVRPAAGTSGASERSPGRWEYEFPRTFTADRLGEYAFGPARLKGRVAAGVTGQSNLRVETVYAVAKAITVRVKDVPLAGRPATYVHAVGAFEASADLEPRQAKVGDPLTLTITLRGQGTLDAAIPPDLSELDDVRERFRVYEATTKADDDRRQFIYSLRPLRADISAFPSIPISYFDVEREQYVTLRTDRLPLEVRAADRLTADEITAPQTAQGRARKPGRDGLYANLKNLGAMRDERVRPGRWLAGLLMLSGLYVAALLAVRRVRRASHDGPSRLRRRRSAGSTARRRLEIAIGQLRAGRRREGLVGIRATIVGLMADARDLEPSGLTTPETLRELARLQLDSDLTRRVSRLLESCDAAQYGAEEGLSAEPEKSAGPLVEALIAALQAKKCLP